MSAETVPARGFPWSARVPLVLALGVLVFSVVTIVRWTGPAVALSYRWQPGDVIRDHMRMAMSVQMQPPILGDELDLEFEMSAVTRVLSVDPQGNATLEITSEDLRVQGSGFPSLPDQFGSELEAPQTLVVAPDGRILESSNPFLGPEAMGDQGFMRNPLLPDEPVAPGDTWEIDDFQKLGLGEGGFDIHADNRLLRYDEVNGVETVVIRSAMSGPFDFTFNPSDLASLLPDEELPAGAASELDGTGTIHYGGELTMEGDYWV
ncbi:MAG: hypothetical protein ACRDHM_02340, partial [Actinomycetota bacterium]